MSVTHICGIRDLAIALMDKCKVDPDVDLYNGEDGQPWNVDPVFTVKNRVKRKEYISYTHILEAICSCNFTLLCNDKEAMQLGALFRTEWITGAGEGGRGGGEERRYTLK